jgi:putative FmdB family regulatory protein
MPIYEYQCEACAHRFEVIQKFSDAPIAVCPKCGGSVEKLLSSPAIQFKGSGFYLTDYGRGTGKPEGGSKSEKSEKSDTAGTKADAKTDGKSEATKSDSGSSASSSSESKPSSTESSAPKPAAKSE